MIMYATVPSEKIFIKNIKYSEVLRKSYATNKPTGIVPVGLFIIVDLSTGVFQKNE